MIRGEGIIAGCAETTYHQPVIRQDEEYSKTVTRMKWVLLSIVCLFGTVLTVQEEYGVGQRKYKISDKLTLERQRDILRLFGHVGQNSYYQDHVDIAKTYSIESNIDAYINSTAVKQFVSLYKQGLLQTEEIFSIFYHPHLEQAISLFKLFYYARDFDTLYKTAVWARNNVNDGLFIYSFSTALTHRDDTFEFILPPIYEVYPYYFFDGGDMLKVQRNTHMRQNGDGDHTVYSNYFGYYLNVNPEHSLSYYLKDIGINSFYYYCNIYYPFWMDGEEFKLKNDRRGEQYYYLYQQLLARYYLERLSNDLGEIEFFNYEEPFLDGYDPSLGYPNGLVFPNRLNHARLAGNLSNYGQSGTFKSRHGYAYIRVQDFERRLRDSVDAGYVFKKDTKLVDLFSSDQIDILGNLVESNPDSLNPRYYGPWQIHARHLLSYSSQPLDQSRAAPVAPSVLEHFETASRDPAFYQLYKRILSIFEHYKQYLPPYTYSEMNYPGVTVEKVDFDRLVTYVDYFDSDASNVLYVHIFPGENSSRGRIRQRRLNHKPFTYRISVTSDKVNDAIVRVYLGPKFDEHGRDIQINENRVNFVEIDIFRHQLQVGQNLIERTSRQTYWFVPDRTSFRELYKRVLGALNNSEEFQLDSSEAFYGFPNRFLLPKGKREGQTFQIYVIVNPYQPPERQEVTQKYYFHKVGTGMNYFDNYAFGFPFDRVIVSTEFKVPNSRFQDVVVYHRGVEDLNATQAQDDTQ